MKAFNDNFIYCTAVACTNTYCDLNQNLIPQADFEREGLPLAMADFWKNCLYGDKWGERVWTIGKEEK